MLSQFAYKLCQSITFLLIFYIIFVLFFCVIHFFVKLTQKIMVDFLGYVKICIKFN